MRRRLLVAAAAMVVVGLAAGGWPPSAAEEVARAGDIAVDDAYARASLGPATTSAAYMTLTNTGARPDRLVAAASPAADAVELHTHRMDGGVMRMRPVGAVDVPAGESVVLQPGGLHLMVIGLREPLAEGASLPLTLTFERAGEVGLELPVRGMAAMRPRRGGGPAAGHGHQETEAPPSN